MTQGLPTEDWSAAGLRCELDGPVATVVLDRPQRRNAQTPAMWRALAEVGRRLTADVRVVCLRAEGVSFSAGLDRAMFTPEGLPGEPPLTAMAAMPQGAAEELIAGYQEAFTWWRRPDLVSVAAVQGHAIGAGFQLALACDLRVLADDAQLAMAETGLGLVPDLGGTRRLVELVGYSRALEICVTGRRVGAAEAVGLGIAELSVAPADLSGAVEDLVAALLAPPRDAVIETKALLARALARTDHEQLQAEREAQVRRLRDLAGTGE